MSLKVVIHQAEEGGYWAEVPTLPGCVSQGDTLKELETNFKEAAMGYMETLQESIQGLQRLQNKDYFLVTNFSPQGSENSQTVEIEI
jgi:predicted RNase H-like HicB family nuclease